MNAFSTRIFTAAFLAIYIIMSTVNVVAMNTLLTHADQSKTEQSSMTLTTITLPRLENNGYPLPEERKVQLFTLSEDGSKAVCVCNDSDIYLIDIKNLPTATITSIGTSVFALSDVLLTTDNTKIIGICKNGTVMRWTLTDPFPLKSEFLFTTEYPISECTVSADGNYIAALSDSACVHVYNATDRLKIIKITPSCLPRHVKLSRDDRLLMIITDHDTSTLFFLEDWPNLDSYEFEEEIILPASMSETNSHITTAIKQHNSSYYACRYFINKHTVTPFYFAQGTDKITHITANEAVTVIVHNDDILQIWHVPHKIPATNSTNTATKLFHCTMPNPLAHIALPHSLSTLAHLFVHLKSQNEAYERFGLLYYDQPAPMEKNVLYPSKESCSKAQLNKQGTTVASLAENGRLTFWPLLLHEKVQKDPLYTATLASSLAHEDAHMGTHTQAFEKTLPQEIYKQELRKRAIALKIGIADISQAMLTNHGDLIVKKRSGSALIFHLQAPHEVSKEDLDILSGDFLHFVVDKTGTLLCALNNKNQIFVWQKSDKQWLKKNQFQVKGEYKQMQISAQGSYLFYLNYHDKKLTIFDRINEQMYQLPDNDILNTAIDEQEEHFITVHTNGSVTLYKTQKAQKLCTLCKHDDIAHLISFSPGCTYAMSASHDYSIGIHDLINKSTTLLKGNKPQSRSPLPPVSKEKLSSNDTKVNSQSDQSLSLVSHTLTEGHISAPISIAGSSKKNNILSGGQDNRLLYWKFLDENITRVPQVHCFTLPRPVEKVVVTPDGSFGLAVSDKTVYVVVLAKEEPFIIPFKLNETIILLDFIPNWEKKNNLVGIAVTAEGTILLIPF